MRKLMSAIIVLGVAALAGCQVGADRTAAALDHQPLVDGRGRSRSLALDGPRLRARLDDDFAQDPPWYAARADARLAVRSGVQTPVTTITRTFTVDRQSFHNHQPHNHYQRTRYRYEVTAGTQ